MQTKFTTLALSTCVAAIAVYSPALAQDQASPPEASGGLQEIVVTAQKREQSLQEVPISISALTAETLERSSIRAASDLPNISPALTYTTGALPSFASFNIRGIGSYVYRIGIQPAVSVVIDGSPLARTSEFAGELGDVERVEVLSGPQGTLFGRNATGGVINIVRKRPTAELGGYAAGELIIGEEGEVEHLVKGAINVPLSDSIRMRLFGYNRQNSDYIDNTNPTALDAGFHHVYGFQGKLAIDLSDSVDVLISGDYLNDRSRNGSATIFIPLQPYQVPTVPTITTRQVALLNGAVGEPFKINTYQPFKSNQELGGGVVDLTWRAMDGLTIKSLTSYRKSKLQGLSPIYFQSARDPQNFPFLSFKAGNNPNQEISRSTHWHYFTQEARAEYSSDFVDVTLGGYYSNLSEKEYSENPTYTSAEARGPAFVAVVGTPAGPDASYPYYYSNSVTDTSDRNKVLAGFLDVTVHATEQLDIFGGYRRSREKTSFIYNRFGYSNLPIRNGVNFNLPLLLPTAPFSPAVALSFRDSKTETLWAGRAGASFQFSDDNRVYATFSRGYIGSGVDQGNAPRGTAANPAGSFILPSIAKSYEIGLKTELFDRRLRLNVAAFITKTKDVQVTALVPGTNINIVQNAGDVDAKGVEVNFEAQPTEAFNINGGVSYLDSEISNLSQRCYPNQANDQNATRPCVGGTQSVDGTVAVNTPKWKLNVAGTYTIPLDSIFDMYLRGEYQYRSKAFFQLDHDPLATQSGYGIINLTVGLTSDSNDLDVRFFVNNLTDKYYCNNMVNGPFFRQGCQSSPIGAQRRFGIAAKKGF